MTKSHGRKFTDNVILVPFGRLRIDRERVSAWTSLLVGREGHRAFLVDALIGGGRRAAYLVTGRRGVGKTAFIESCLRDYNAAVFRRYLRSGHGRSLMDLCVLLLFALLVSFVGLAASELIQYLALDATSDGIQFVTMLLLIPLVLLPGALGVAALHASSELVIGKSPYLATAVGTIGIVWLLWNFGPFGAPAASLGQAILVFGIGALICASVGGCRSQPFVATHHRMLWVGVAIVPPLLLLFIPLDWLDGIGRLLVPESGEGRSVAVAQAMIGVGLVGAVALSDYAFLLLVRLDPKFLQRLGPGRKPISLDEEDGRRINDMWLRNLILLCSGMLLFLLMCIRLLGTPPEIAFAIAVTLGLVTVALAFLRRWQLNGSEERVFAPPVEFLLIFKAVVLIALSLQLLYPVAGAFPERAASAMSEDHPSAGASSDIRAPIQLGARSHEEPTLKPNGTAAPTSVISTCNESPVGNLIERGEDGNETVTTCPYWTLFYKGLGEESLWLILVVAFIACCYILEFDWIGRPFLAQREPRALDRGLRKRYHQHHDLDPIWIEQARAVAKRKVREFLDRNKIAGKEWSRDLPEDIGEFYRFQIFLKRVDKNWLHEPEQQERFDRLTRYFSLYFAPNKYEEHRLSRLIRRNAKRPEKPRTFYGPNYRLHKAHASSLYKFRKMERFTFPHLLCRFWMPTLVVRINLGFDRLDHKGVTHAMLHGLRSAYQRKLVAWRSPYGMTGIIVKTLLLLLAVSFIGRGYIDFPDLDLEESRQDRWVSLPSFVGSDPEKQQAKRIDYCAALASVNNEGADQKAVIPRAMCGFAPDTANALFPLLFAELLWLDIGDRYKLHADPRVNFRDDDPFAEEDSSTENIADDRPKHLVFYVTHFNHGLPVWSTSGTREKEFAQRSSLSFRVYHLLLFIVLVWLWKLLFSRFVVLPYRANLKRLDELNEALNMRRTERISKGAWSPARWIRMVFADEREAETSQDQLDPRSVELAVLEILEDMQESRLSVPLVLGTAFSIPAPEINFVFDELDKIGGVAAAEGTAYGVGEEEAGAIEAERRRAYALQHLLSDMKRIISSAPARFIFVGGRMVHDEWVRDHNRIGTRQPLLSSIFDAELYLPSLLLDMPKVHYSTSVGGTGRRDRALSSRIEEFLLRTYDSAVELNDDIFSSRHAPFLALRTAQHSPLNFCETPFVPGETAKLMTFLDLNQGGKLDSDKEPEGMSRREALFDELVGFLSYRSAGAPKKLRELLIRFARPTAYFSGDDNSPAIPSRDVLAFDDADIYRIQFIDSVFRHIAQRFEIRLVDRDDKVTINLIFLFDFIMKLHGRAFSWSTLERIDELAHIHRAPDLRNLFDEVIEGSSQRYFHRLLNGLYGFRFKSEFAMEIRYLSRLSEQEMAALNFTLDESQELKSAYSDVIDVSGQANADIVAALGELYEYDQAYDIARGYYERAVQLIDAEFTRQLGDTMQPEDSIADDLRAAGKQAVKKPKDADRRELVAALSQYTPLGSSPFLFAVLANELGAGRALSYYSPWVVRRIRLMLQIGATFEQAQDLERAQSHYHAAHLLAQSALRFAFGERSEDALWFRQLVKHLNVLYQPLFATVWIAEKLPSGVDTSLTLLERELREMRRLFPFASEALNANSAGDVLDSSGSDSNMSLVVAELHNKAGDLYFFKGRSSNIDLSLRPDWKGALPEDEPNSGQEANVDPLLKAWNDTVSMETHRQSPQSTSPEGEEESGDGYTLRAHDHYTIALHHIRRYVTYRRESSTGRLNVTMSGQVGSDWPTHRRNLWPTFVSQAAHNTLVDIADATLARVMLRPLWKELHDTTGLRDKKWRTPAGLRDYIDEFDNALNTWFETGDCEVNENFDNADEDKPEGQIARFFGRWEIQDDETGTPKARFKSITSTASRMVTGLLLGLGGARYARKAGFIESAMTEVLFVAEHATRYLHWMRIMRRFPPDGEKETSNHRSVMIVLAEIAFEALKRYNTGRRTIRDTREKDGYCIGKSTSVEAASTLCKLQLLLSGITSADIRERVEALRGKIDGLLCEWVGDTGKPGAGCRAMDAIVEKGDFNCSDRHRERAWCLLKYIVARHRFPALANMMGLKTLIDDVLLNDFENDRTADDKSLSDVLEWMLELDDTERRFDAPMHFAPLMLFETFGLAAATLRKTALGDEDLLSEFRRVAAKTGLRAAESFSMGNQYYKNISRLHYVFDDFNDRRLHVNHAAQMSGADLLPWLTIRYRANLTS